MLPRILRPALLAALAAATPALAQWNVMKNESDSIEAAAHSVTLPPDASGSLHVVPCPRCAIVSLRASAQSAYFIGGQQVSLEELRRLAATRPDTLLVISYTTATKALRRVRASAADAR
jgi:hypothetical protein